MQPMTAHPHVMDNLTHHALDRPAAAGSSARSRVPAADGLRGLAALGIVVFHTAFVSDASSGSGLAQSVLARLDVGVPIFFALSGFLLFVPYLSRIVHDQDLGNARGFWRRRAIRIFPAFWVALIAQLIIGAIAVRGITGFLLAFTLTHAYAGTYVLSGITQSWSMSTEVGFYILLPFYAVLAARASRRRTPVQKVMIIAAMSTAWIAISTISRALIHKSSLPYANSFRFTVIANADYFAVGLILACLVVGSEVSPTLLRLREVLFARVWWWYAASVLVLLVVATQLGLPRGLAEASTARELARQFGYSMVGLFAVAPACCALSGGRILGSRPFVWLGLVSYGVYLWHQVFIAAPGGRDGFLFRLFGWHTFSAPFVPLLVMTTLGALVLGAASWYLLERPLLERFR